jgi:ESS family glutamate:Na+ symporter
MLLFLILIGVISYHLSHKYFHDYLSSRSIYIPLSILLGIVGLALLEIFQLQQYKSHLEEVVSLFLSFIFCLLPVAIKKSEKGLLKKVRPLWFYFFLQYILQWSLAGLIFYVIIRNFWTLPTPNFISVLPTSFAGGHGAAAALGEIFRTLGDSEIYGLSMFTATIGLAMSIIGGVIILTVHRSKDHVLKEDTLVINRRDIRKIIFHCVFYTGLAYALNPVINMLIKTKAPVFAIAFGLGFLANKIRPLKLDNHEVVDWANNHLTEILVIFGIVSIKLKLIYAFWGPLITIIISGLLLAIFMYKIVLPKIVPDRPHAVGIFTWGWSLGGIVIGLSLFSQLDRETRQYYFPRIALAYMFVAPVEVILLLTMPYLLIKL